MGNLAQLPTEMLQTQISNGLVLLVLGMGVVFVFLALLIFATKFMSKIVGKISKGNDLAVKSAPAQTVQNSVSADTEVAIAIAAAFQKSKQ